MYVAPLIQNYGQRKLNDTAVKLDLPKSMVYEIVHEKLGYRNVSSHFARKQFTVDHYFWRMGWYGWNIFQHSPDSSDLFLHIIICLFLHIIICFSYILSSDLFLHIIICLGHSNVFYLVSGSTCSSRGLFICSSTDGTIIWLAKKVK